MKRLIFILLISSVSAVAHGQLENWDTIGKNDVVTIRHLSQVEGEAYEDKRPTWGYTYQLTGFLVGTGIVMMVPVTREASQVLGALNKESVYECIIEEATFVPTIERNFVIGGTYYIIDLQC